MFFIRVNMFSDSLDKFAIQLDDVLPLDSMLEIEVAPERVLVFLDGATEGA